MKSMVLVIALVWFLPAASPQETRTSENREALIVADQFYWAGLEGNLAAEVIGKFQSEEKLAETLSLQKEIGVFKAKRDPFNLRIWKLRDVLLRLDFNANGNVATWRVSGPKPLILSYVNDLRERYEDKTVFYDFSYRLLDARPTAD